MNLKPAVLKNFVFDWALCFCLCEVYRFQNLVGLQLPIKHALKEVHEFTINQVTLQNLFKQNTTKETHNIINSFIIFILLFRFIKLLEQIMP